MDKTEWSAAPHPPRISDVIYLLQKWRPAALSSLREKYSAATRPEVREVLSEGRMLGEATAEPSDLLAWEVTAEAVSIGLAEAIAKCRTTAERLRGKLNWARRWQFLAEILGVLGPASIWAVIAKDSHYAQVPAAIFTLLGVVIAIVAQYARQQPYGKGALLDTFSELNDYRASGESVKARVGPANQPETQRTRG